MVRMLPGNDKQVDGCDPGGRRAGMGRIEVPRFCLDSNQKARQSLEMIMRNSKTVRRLLTDTENVLKRLPKKENGHRQVCLQMSLPEEDDSLMKESRRQWNSPNEKGFDSQKKWPGL